MQFFSYSNPCLKAALYILSVLICICTHVCIYLKYISVGWIRLSRCTGSCNKFIHVGSSGTLMCYALNQHCPRKFWMYPAQIFEGSICCQSSAWNILQCSVPDGIYIAMKLIMGKKSGTDLNIKIGHNWSVNSFVKILFTATRCFIAPLLN